MNLSLKGHTSELNKYSDMAFMNFVFVDMWGDHWNHDRAIGHVIQIKPDAHVHNHAIVIRLEKVVRGQRIPFEIFTRNVHLVCRIR